MEIGGWRLWAIGGAAFIAAMAGPAQAFDDRPSTLEPLWNILGASGDEKEAIDFRERPKLVVPKQMDLPPPQSSAGRRAANWPQDPDVKRRKAGELNARAPRQIEMNANPIIRNRELLEGRTTEARSQADICETYNQGAPDCSAPTPAEKLKRIFASGEDKDVLTPGREPDRTYLTEPPRGYRSATRAVQAERPRPTERVDPADPKAYLRDQNKSRRDE